MIKRPLHPQFNQPVRAGQKVTTIRDTSWPVGVPIMLYNWTGAAYRSKQRDVAAVVAESAREIWISHLPCGQMVFSYGGDTLPAPLFATEGFPAQSAMDAWFRAVVPEGQNRLKYLMVFRLAEPPAAGTDKIITTIEEIEAMPGMFPETATLLSMAKEAQRTGRLPEL